MTARQIIELKKGVKVDLLFTPSLFGVAKRKGLSVTIKNQEDAIEVMEAYVKLAYIAALNAWEAKQYDDPELGDFGYRYGDFQEWAGDNPNELARLIPFIYTALTGKDLKAVVKQNSEGNQPVKKKASLDLLGVYDWAEMQTFLIGRCGRSERDTYYVTMLEYNALVDGQEKAFRERMELSRWEKYIDAQMNGFLKRRPNSPEELVTFPWERVKTSEPFISEISDADAEALTNIFKQANF